MIKNENKSLDNKKILSICTRAGHLGLAVLWLMSNAKKAKIGVARFGLFEAKKKLGLFIKLFDSKMFENLLSSGLF